MKTNPNDFAFNTDVTKMQTINDGVIEAHNPPLTKREHFAGLAMQGYISADYTANSGMPFKSMALWSVQMADALIAELNRTQD